MMVGFLMQCGCCLGSWFGIVGVADGSSIRFTLEGIYSASLEGSLADLPEHIFPRLWEWTLVALLLYLFGVLHFFRGRGGEPDI